MRYGRKKHPTCLGRSALIVFVLSLLLSTGTGCRKKAPAPATPADHSAKMPPDSAPQAITPSVIPSSKPVIESSPVPKVLVPNSLDLGIKSFKTGDYGAAVQHIEEYLGTGSSSENRDLALFHLFLSRTLMGNSGKNPRQAEDALKRLVSEFPKSPYAESAEMIADLQTQIEGLKSDIREKEIKVKQLSEELQKLKDIDLQRRPSRPPY